MKRTTGITLLVATTLLIGGCTTKEERRAGYQEDCKAYGFDPGTESFAACMLKVAENDQTRRMIEGNAQITRGLAMMNGETY